MRRTTTVNAERRGFTLVELLVVIAIIATIFGLMLVGSRPGESSEVRRAAQQFASALLSAQSRGMGNPSGAAVVLESLGLSAVSVFNADVPPLIPATVSGGIPPEDPNAAAIDVWIDARGIDLARGLRIQFLGTAPTMPPSAWFGFKPPGTVLMRVDEGQTPFNTLWPSVMGGQCEARISSYPAKGDLALRYVERRVAHDHVGERALAGSVWPHQGMYFSRLNGQVDPLEDLLLAGAYVQIADL